MDRATDRSNQRRLGQAQLLRAGQLIRELREAAGVTRNKLCAEIGMQLGQLSDIERGIQHVSLRRAFQIAEVLKVPFDKVVEEILRDKLYEAGFRDVDLKVVLPARQQATVTVVDDKQQA